MTLRRPVTLIVTLLIVLGSTSVKAIDSCRSLFDQPFLAQPLSVRNLVKPDAYAQWMLWEQTANLPQFLKLTKPVELNYATPSEEKIEAHADPSLPQSIVEKFKNGNGKILWLKHPFNQETTTPYFHDKVSGSLSAYFSASRSMILDGDLRGFTIKGPSDYPHGPDGPYQKLKSNTKEDVLLALRRSELIKKIDATIGEDPVVIILPEVMTVADKQTEIGYVVRDVRRLDDGNYYLPAFSIPFVGREIAAINGVPFEEFWQEHYAKVLGESKARLLLRYGLQMVTPNAQNMLIQLDRNLKPTGKIVYRDLSDTRYIDRIAQALGFENEVHDDMNIKCDIDYNLWPNISFSLGGMTKIGTSSVSDNALLKWTYFHNRAYIEYILRALRLERPQLLEMNASMTSKSSINS
jgi:hypothetical protein